MADKSLELCARCQIAPKNPHKNAKYCYSCGDFGTYAKHPTFTEDQITLLHELAGVRPVAEISRRLETSVSSLYRYAHENKLSFRIKKV